MRLFRARESFGGCGVAVVRSVYSAQAGAFVPQEQEARCRAAVQRAEQLLLCQEEQAGANGKEQVQAARNMLTDAGLMQEIGNQLAQGQGAVPAVERAAGIYAGVLRAAREDDVRERACVVLDVCALLAELLEAQPDDACPITQPCILAAPVLEEQQLYQIPRELLRGVVVQSTGLYAPAALVAHRWGIPFLTGVDAEFFAQCSGVRAAVDATAAEVFLEPEQSVIARLTHRQKQIARMQPCRLAAGAAHGVVLQAVCDTQQLSKVAEYGFREVVWLPETLPTQGLARQELRRQRQLLAQGAVHAVIAPVGECGTELVGRQLQSLLYVTADTALQLAVSHTYTKVQLEQRVDEIRGLRRTLRKEGLDLCERLSIGVMLDTPAAVLQMEELAPEAAFFCIDCVHLAQAACAESPQRGMLHPETSRALVQLVKLAADHAQMLQRKLYAICAGAGAAQQAGLLAAQGVRYLAVPLASAAEAAQQIHSRIADASNTDITSVCTASGR